MKKIFKTSLALVGLIVLGTGSKAQGIQLGEVIMISTTSLKAEVRKEAFEDCMTKINSSWKTKNQGIEMKLFRADRGGRKGEDLLVCTISNVSDRTALSIGSPFTDEVLNAKSASLCRLSDYVSNTSAYTEYRLIGPEKLKSLPVAGILGIHFIKVKKERSLEFEKFVIDKLHPAVGQLFPDLQLLYFKAVAGDNTGSYITIFSLESLAARDKYWPGGKDAEILKQAFKPLQDLAKELGPYLVEGSYLEPTSGAAAAYFESRQWTDFVVQ